jgi:hypothetical protein
MKIEFSQQILEKKAQISNAINLHPVGRLLTEPCALGSTRPLKMSTRTLLRVKMAGA